MIRQPGQRRGAVGQLPAHHGPGVSHGSASADVPGRPDDPCLRQVAGDSAHTSRVDPRRQLDSGPHVIGCGGAGVEEPSE
jgi:hypothetical protein